MKNGTDGKRKNPFDEEIDELGKEIHRDYLKRRDAARLEKNPPYSVDCCDQFHFYDEEEYYSVGKYDTLEEAIKVADEITREGIGTKSIEGWLGLGEAGLVYDSRGCHVWSGITEYIIKDENEKMFRAIEFATKAHYGYFRKGGSLPYIIHPLGVARILIESGCINKVIIAGILHDVVEDTSFTLEDIRENFGEDVAGLVKCVTEPDKSDTWENRKRQKIEYLKSAPSRVLLVACADKLDNIRAIRHGCARDKDSFWSFFNASREGQEWYYRSLAEVFSDYTTGNVYASLFKDFVAEVQNVFGKVKEGGTQNG